MTNEQIKSEFYAFLKKHNALIKWEKNTINSGFDLKHFFDIEHNPIKSIIQAFMWNETPEGRSYWADLNEKWVEHYNNLTK